MMCRTTQSKRGNMPGCVGMTLPRVAWHSTPKASNDCRAWERGNLPKGGSHAKSLRRRLDVGFPCYAVVASRPVGERGRTVQSITNGAYLRRHFEARPASPIIQRVATNLCGIGLGGYCPGGYRACLRSGTPKAECDLILARCDECNQAMVDCREKVGVEPGYTCAKCRKALYRCRARMSVVPK